MVGGWIMTALALTLTHGEIQVNVRAESVTERARGSHLTAALVAVSVACVTDPNTDCPPLPDHGTSVP